MAYIDAWAGLTPPTTGHLWRCWKICDQLELLVKVDADIVAICCISYDVLTLCSCTLARYKLMCAFWLKDPNERPIIFGDLWPTEAACGNGLWQLTTTTRGCSCCQQRLLDSRLLGFRLSLQTSMVWKSLCFIANSNFSKMLLLIYINWLTGQHDCKGTTVIERCGVKSIFIRKMIL